jgi:lipid A disaccharide synthetase
MDLSGPEPSLFVAKTDFRVSMVAAERSGDMLAALLLKGMHKSWPGLQASGIGGPQMSATGFVARWSCDELSVRGLVDYCSLISSQYSNINSIYFIISIRPYNALAYLSSHLISRYL